MVAPYTQDIIYGGKREYNEFLSSDEHIAPNILATRLKQLQDKGLLIKKPHPKDRRKEVYEPTEDALDLMPVLRELAIWGAKHVQQKDGSIVASILAVSDSTVQHHNAQVNHTNKELV